MMNDGDCTMPISDAQHNRLGDFALDYLKHISTKDAKPDFQLCARATFAAAYAHGWRGPVQIKEYTVQCLIGAGVASDDARRIVTEEWIEWETVK